VELRGVVGILFSRCSFVRFETVILHLGYTSQNQARSNLQKLIKREMAGCVSLWDFAPFSLVEIEVYRCLVSPSSGR
jgi:hypothetical protein